MNSFVDFLALAVWRASWQAAVIALVVYVVLRFFGNRIAPQWRFLLWSVVLVRLLVIVTPASPWSLFNLAHWERVESIDKPVETTASQPLVVSPQHTAHDDRATKIANNGPAESIVPMDASFSIAAASPVVANVAGESSEPIAAEPFVHRVASVLSLVWLAGCSWFAARLLLAAIVLRRRLSVCLPVRDAAVLNLLNNVRQQLGLKRTPALLVSPESISPCVVGTLRPKIIVPESLITEESTGRLRHVLAHELAHLVRGDLWTNWLLLTARVLHWFSPVAWWTIRELQSEREAACDELALAALGQTNRSTYAKTILDLASTLTPSPIAPGMIGLFSSARRLQRRIERLAKSVSATTVRTPTVIALLTAIAMFGLTDKMPKVAADDPVNSKPQEAEDDSTAAANAGGEGAKSFVIRGVCIDQKRHPLPEGGQRLEKIPMAGARMTLYAAKGRLAPPVPIAEVATDKEGRFEFVGLEPPRPDASVDRLTYEVFADYEGRPLGWGINKSNPEATEINVTGKSATLTGRVVDERGDPVEGATAFYIDLDERVIPGVLSAKTDGEGRFFIERLTSISPDRGGTRIIVKHPNYPRTTAKVVALPTDMVVTLRKGCAVTGSVVDEITSRPAVNAIVTIENLNTYDVEVLPTDDDGRFRVVVPEGRFHIKVAARDRICIAAANLDFSNESTELPPFKLIQGGFIAGQVVNTATGKPMTTTDRGEQISIGFFGPSQPMGRSIRPTAAATVDNEGRFKFRAAPGDNFPYLVNIHGQRMAWDTSKKPAVVVREGKTTTYDMLITPEIPPAEKLKAAEKIVAALPKKLDERTVAIIEEFRKLNHTVDETELWCMLMRELVAIGPAAVPQLSAALDQATNDRELRRLAFAARAIGDPRVVPALIRVIPRTMLPSASDFGLIVADPELTKFMQQHDLDGQRGGTHFGFGRAVREVFGALHKLTKQNFKDEELYGISASDEPRRQVLQRRYYLRNARAWQTWWETHWREFTDDAAYQKVGLQVADEQLPATEKLSANAKLGDGAIGHILSPAAQKGKFADHFMDLDTGRELQWPAQWERDENKVDPRQLAEWVNENGVDLMCITHRSPEGEATYVLKGFGLKAWEISPRDLRNLDKLFAAGKLPEGRAVDDLLMHYDEATKQHVPDANAAFIYVTKEGCMGLIEITDRVTRTKNLTGTFGDPPKGVGFFLGVRFNLKTIVP